MKRAMLILTVVCAYFVSIQAQELKNGDFENWKADSKLPTYWFVPYKTTGFLEKSTDARTGKNAVRMVYTPKKNGDNKRFRSATMKFSKGTYTLSMFLKGKGEMRYITLTEKDAKPGSKASDVNTVGLPKVGAVDAKDWKQHDLKYEIPADGEYQLHICFNMGSEDEPFLVDDVSISKN